MASRKRVTLFRGSRTYSVSVDSPQNNRMSGMATLEVFDRTWKALRQSGALNTLLINELVPVPDISTASSLGLFSVFIKSKENVLSVLRPTYHVIGHVGQIAQLERMDIKRLLESYSPHNESTSWLPNRKWEADVAMGHEMVHITLHDITKLVLPLNLSEGDVYLNMNIPELSSAKTVYIVTDVLKVSGMTVAVSGDDDRVTFQNLNSHIPVGFAYKKFRLRTDGCVCEAMDSGIRMEAKWRVLTDHLTPYLNILPALDD